MEGFQRQVLTTHRSLHDRTSTICIDSRFILAKCQWRTVVTSAQRALSDECPLVVGSSPSQQVLDSIWAAFSDFSLLGHFESVIDLDSQISDSAFNLGMPEQQLHCS